jgi:hypothetical protein
MTVSVKIKMPGNSPAFLFNVLTCFHYLTLFLATTSNGMKLFDDDVSKTRIVDMIGHFD